MDSSRIAESLNPYTVGLNLPPGIYDQLGGYLELLLRWNAKTNLTAVREPEQIVTRHFGESLFAAGVLFGSAGPAPRLFSRVKRGGVERPAFSDNRQPAADNLLSFPGAPLISGAGVSETQPARSATVTLADLGSGAGFPGLPIKLAFPALQVTLIESQNKKATFLKEVIRMLRLENIEVYSGRAEQWGKQADIVTLRAVEKFEAILPLAKNLVVAGGRLCLLIGRTQTDALANIAALTVEVEQSVPGRPNSLVVVGNCS